MKILIVSQYFWPENFRINDLALGLTERGHEVTVLTGIPNYPAGRFFSGYGFFSNRKQDYHGIRVMRVPLVPRGAGGGFRLALNYISFAVSASVLAPVLCRGNFDVIFVFEPSPITVGLPALVLKKIKSAPILFWVQDLWPESLSAAGTVDSPWILNMVNRVVRHIYKKCDLILVASRAYIEPVRALGVDISKIIYFPQCAEAIYKPVELEEDAPERSLLPEGFRVMFAGNIGEAQSFDTILDAAEKTRRIPDIKWIVVGEGRRRVWVQDDIKKRKLSGTVRLIGQYPVESMPRFFALADALLVTLKKEPIFSFVIPAKLQSYLACGKPVVAAVDGEARNLIREAKAGLTCAAEDADALAAAVISLYKMSADERHAMGQRGVRYYEANFSRDVLIGRLEGWMKDVMSSSRADS